MLAPLDTLQIVKGLREAGFAEPQAEALTTVFRDLRETDLSLLATKADIQLLKTNLDRLEAKLTTFATKADLDAKIAELKVEVIRWVFGIAFAQAALILAVLKLFPSAHR
jgi:hypothetical protein